MLRLPNKRLRAEVIARYVREAGYKGVVCFSCGNAARALKEQGLEVVEVSPGGPLKPGRWWTLGEIRRAFPLLLDATSGHLPAPLMWDIARAFRGHLGALAPGPHMVPTGSGETIVCLRMAYPEVRFVAVYGLDAATRYNEQAPLNALVVAGGPVRHRRARTARVRPAQRRARCPRPP